MSRDLRKYARQTNVRLLIGFILILFVVGDGLIYWFYGRGAALMGLLCMAVGLGPVLLIWLILAVMEWAVKRVDNE
jgi:hypothetical protein